MYFERFEWDDAKADANWAKHGVDFIWVTRAFSDVFAIEWLDDRFDYGEQRFNMLAMCEGIVVHVSFVETVERIRLISARRATRHEHARYFRENS